MTPQVSFTGQPVRSLQTMLRTIATADPEMPTVVPDGFYGPATMNAVSAFQRKHALVTNGVVDQLTWETIVSEYELALIETSPAEAINIVMETGEIYQIGDSNPYVYLLQSILSHLSNVNAAIPSVEHNGTIDEQTVEAILAFQKLAGLPETGCVNKQTWKHLVAHFSLSAMNNIRRENI